MGLDHGLPQNFYHTRFTACHIYFMPRTTLLILTETLQFLRRMPSPVNDRHGTESEKNHERLIHIQPAHE